MTGFAYEALEHNDIINDSNWPKQNTLTAVWYRRGILVAEGACKDLNEDFSGEDRTEDELPEEEGDRDHSSTNIRTRVRPARSRQNWQSQRNIHYAHNMILEEGVSGVWRLGIFLKVQGEKEKDNKRKLH